MGKFKGLFNKDGSKNKSYVDGLNQKENMNYRGYSIDDTVVLSPEDLEKVKGGITLTAEEKNEILEDLYKEDEKVTRK